jgi:hypothetical protein
MQRAQAFEKPPLAFEKPPLGFEKQEKAPGKELEKLERLPSRSLPLGR